MRCRYVIMRSLRTWDGRLERVRTLAAERHLNTLLHETARFVQRSLFGEHSTHVPNTSVSSGEFDTQYGTDTARSIPVGSLGIGGRSYTHAYQYEPSPVEDFVAILDSLPICFEQYTFIDIGSGKGRIILAAARWPFKEIIGVEISEILHNIAQET